MARSPPRHASLSILAVIIQGEAKGLVAGDRSQFSKAGKSSVTAGLCVGLSIILLPTTNSIHLHEVIPRPMLGRGEPA